MGLAGLLHGLCTGADQLQSRLEVERSGGHQGRELAQAVAGRHVGRELRIRERQNDAMQEHGRLGDLRLLEVILAAAEHYVGELEAKDRVGAVHQLLCLGVLLVEFVAHAGELCTLAGEYVCFHERKKVFSGRGEARASLAPRFRTAKVRIFREYLPGL